MLFKADVHWVQKYVGWSSAWDPGFLCRYSWFFDTSNDWRGGEREREVSPLPLEDKCPVMPLKGRAGKRGSYRAIWDLRAIIRSLSQVNGINWWNVRGGRRNWENDEREVRGTNITRLDWGRETQSPLKSKHTKMQMRYNWCLLPLKLKLYPRIKCSLHLSRLKAFGGEIGILKRQCDADPDRWKPSNFKKTLSISLQFRFPIEALLAWERL